MAVAQFPGARVAQSCSLRALAALNGRACRITTKVRATEVRWGMHSVRPHSCSLLGLDKKLFPSETLSALPIASESD